MPILQNVQNDTFFGTIVQMGTGDVAVANCVDENSKPVPAMLLWQSHEKPVEDWGLDKGFEYDNEKVQKVTGTGVQIQFGRVESVDVLIQVLQEIRKQMTI